MIHKFQLSTDDAYRQRLKDAIDQVIPDDMNTSEQTNLHFVDDWKMLQIKIKETVLSYLSLQPTDYHLYLPPENADIWIMKSWGIKTKPKEMLRYGNHNHAYAHLAFCYYLDVPDKSGNTFFQNGFMESQYPVKSNDIMLWPGHIEHRIPTNLGDKPRYTIAGDLMLFDKTDTNVHWGSPVDKWIKL